MALRRHHRAVERGGPGPLVDCGDGGDVRRWKDGGLLFTRWEDEESFRVWHRSPAHHRSHAMMPPGLKLDPSKTRLFVGERIDRAATGECQTRRL